MRILFLGLNYAPETIGIGPYSSGLCEGLSAMGHEVRVVAAQPYYPQWRVFDDFGGLRWRHGDQGGVDVVRCPIYVPARPSGTRRIIHHASFALSAFLPMLRAATSFRPDVVITVVPSLLAAPVARLAARIAGARSWVHVQDFEVDAAFATGLLKRESGVGRLATWLQRKVLSGFDRVSSISPEMCARLKGFGIPTARIVEFRNWAEIDTIKPLTRPSAYRGEWNIRSPHVALYSGSIANKQGLETVVQAARLLRHRQDLCFVICGEGPNLAALEAQALGLDNIRFEPLQPADRLGDLLGLATVHVLPQTANAADLVLPSKLTNMLASGRPVIATAATGTGLAREIEGCGVVTPPGDAAALAEAILRLIDDPAGRSRLGAAARQRAETAWNRERIIEGMDDRLDALLHPPGKPASHKASGDGQDAVDLIGAVAKGDPKP